MSSKIILYENKLRDNAVTNRLMCKKNYFFVLILFVVCCFFPCNLAGQVQVEEQLKTLKENLSLLSRSLTTLREKLTALLGKVSGKKTSSSGKSSAQGDAQEEISSDESKKFLALFEAKNNYYDLRNQFFLTQKELKYLQAELEKIKLLNADSNNDKFKEFIKDYYNICQNDLFFEGYYYYDDASDPIKIVCQIGKDVDNQKDKICQWINDQLNKAQEKVTEQQEIVKGLQDGLAASLRAQENAERTFNLDRYLNSVTSPVITADLAALSLAFDEKLTELYDDLKKAYQVYSKKLEDSYIEETAPEHIQAVNDRIDAFNQKMFNLRESSQGASLRECCFFLCKKLCPNLTIDFSEEERKSYLLLAHKSLKEENINKYNHLLIRYELKLLAQLLKKSPYAQKLPKWSGNKLVDYCTGLVFDDNNPEESNAAILEKIRAFEYENLSELFSLKSIPDNFLLNRDVGWMKECAMILKLIAGESIQLDNKGVPVYFFAALFAIKASVGEELLSFYESAEHIKRLPEYQVFEDLKKQYAALDQSPSQDQELARLVMLNQNAMTKTDVVTLTNFMTKVSAYTAGNEYKSNKDKNKFSYQLSSGRTIEFLFDKNVNVVSDLYQKWSTSANNQYSKELISIVQSIKSQAQAHVNESKEKKEKLEKAIISRAQALDEFTRVHVVLLKEKNKNSGPDAGEPDERVMREKWYLHSVLDNNNYDNRKEHERESLASGQNEEIEQALSLPQKEIMEKVKKAAKSRKNAAKSTVVPAVLQPLDWMAASGMSIDLFSTPSLIYYLEMVPVIEPKQQNKPSPDTRKLAAASSSTSGSITTPSGPSTADKDQPEGPKPALQKDDREEEDADARAKRKEREDANAELDKKDKERLEKEKEQAARKLALEAKKASASSELKKSINDFLAEAHSFRKILALISPDKLKGLKDDETLKNLDLGTFSYQSRLNRAQKSFNLVLLASLFTSVFNDSFDLLKCLKAYWENGENISTVQVMAIYSLVNKDNNFLRYTKNSLNDIDPSTQTINDIIGVMNFGMCAYLYAFECFWKQLEFFCLIVDNPYYDLVGLFPAIQGLLSRVDALSKQPGMWQENANVGSQLRAIYQDGLSFDQQIKKLSVEVEEFNKSSGNDQKTQDEVNRLFLIVDSGFNEIAKKVYLLQQSINTHEQFYHAVKNLSDRMNLVKRKLEFYKQAQQVNKPVIASIKKAQKNTEISIKNLGRLYNQFLAFYNKKP